MVVADSNSHGQEQPEMEGHLLQDPSPEAAPDSQPSMQATGSYFVLPLAAGTPLSAGAQKPAHPGKMFHPPGQASLSCHWPLDLVPAALAAKVCSVFPCRSNQKKTLGTGGNSLSP